MIFDKYFKIKIEEQIGNYLGTNYKVIMVNDTAYKIDELLKKSYRRDTLFTIVRAGNATKSNVPGYDLNTEQIVISLVCWQGAKDDVLIAIHNFCSAENAKLKTADLEDNVIVKYRAVYGTPSVSGATFDMRCDYGLDKAVLMTWVISVNYGTNAYITPHVYELTVGQVKYTVNGIYNVERAVTPSYTQTNGTGECRMQNTVVANVSTYVFLIFKISGDTLQENIFDREVKYGDGLFDKSIVLSIDGDTVSSVVYDSLSETYENNTAAYRLSLRK